MTQKIQGIAEGFSKSEEIRIEALRAACQIYQGAGGSRSLIETAVMKLAEGFEDFLKGSR